MSENYRISKKRYSKETFFISLGLLDNQKYAEIIESAWGPRARLLYETYFAAENSPPLPPDNVIKAMGGGAWQFIRDYRRV